MHVPSQNDPAPDSQTFQDHVICEHGHLALNLSARTRISHKVRQQTLRLGSDFMAPRLSDCSRHSFHWDTLSDAVSPCAVCAALAENSREDKRELRKKAEEEKVHRQPFYGHKPQLLTS